MAPIDAFSTNPQAAFSQPARLARGSRKSGFSLVECVLALGVVSFAFVSLVGVIPVGLNTFHNAIDATMAAQIAQSVITDVRQAKFSEATYFNRNADANPSKPSPDFYYDEEGKTASAADHVYEAAVLVNYTSKPPVGVEPTQLTADPASAPMAVVRVVVRRISAPDQVREFTAVVANNGL